MSQQKDIESRLQNWSRWCQVRTRPSDANSITGFICDRMRKAALGNVWSGHEVSDPVDEVDAVLLERTVVKLIPKQFLLLKMYYVTRLPADITCRRLRIRVRPSLHFDQAMTEAKAAIEKLLTLEA
ncbi:hypothetical protein NX774_12135 [Massilia agilis]|uniref:Antitermination protein Q n=1 Tax=Massilia agilis TaxID=1811226 RepID=A0ABT2DCT4_9BURK|nr:hypothetical protein [Massilia agilis]MCS0808669.1 hypothetical protein [Massilia agilis]